MNNNLVEERSQINMDQLGEGLEHDHVKFLNNEPFPHILLDNFLNQEDAEKILDEFPKSNRAQWIHYLHYNEKKFGLNNHEQLPPTIKTLIEELHSETFRNYLSNVSGIDNLIADPALEGGGLHLSERGGFLNVHADFTVHPHHPDWERRLNLLIYLNQEWEESYRGDLELWTRDMKRCEQRIAPVFNRCVIFATKADSYHGFPDPIQCPEGMLRKSIAIYYYTQSKEKVRIKSTNYRARPQDGSKSILIWLDKKLVNLYTRLKKTFGLSDDFASKVLGFLNRRKK